jgi:hypothetical protein
MMAVVLTQKHKGYNSGETVGLPDDEARALIEARIARPFQTVTKGAAESAPEPKAGKKRAAKKTARRGGR